MRGSSPRMTNGANGYSHFTSWRASTSRTLATRSASLHENCAGRLSRHSWLEAIVAAAAADRAEAYGTALLVLGVEQEFDLVDGAGVVFEAADDGGVDLDAIFAVAGGNHELADLFELIATLLSNDARTEARINR